MIKKILVPTDGSKHARRAIEYACDLALKYDAKVYLLHVIQKIDIPAGISEYLEAEGVEESPENVYLAKIGDKVVEVAEKDVKMKGVKDSQSVVLQGDPAERIVEFARGNGIDMIIVGSRGLGSVEQLFLGSVSHKVCHLAECTCITVK
jgi:nucleotide-binding universal stress UspA family protein